MTGLSTILRCAVALACLAKPLAGQDPRLAERFPPDVVTRLSLVIDSTSREGLPTEPLILRALEGSAKGAAPDRIVAVLSRLHAALRTARATIGPDAAPTELTTAASALEAGVSPGRLVELRQLRAGQTLTAPLGAYLDLIARGAAPDRAWNRIADLAKHRAADTDYLKLSPLDVDHDPPPQPTADQLDEATEAGWMLFTGGGEGQLDRMPAGAISAMGGNIVQPFGALRIHVDGATADHAGIGTTGSMGGEIRYTMARGPWQIDVGPLVASGRDIGEAWTNATGVLAEATRTIGVWSVFGALRGGAAWTGPNGSLWAAHAAGGAVRVGNFRFSAAWRGATMADSTAQTAGFRLDTIPTPADSFPRPVGPVVQRVYDTTYQAHRHDLHDVSFATAWARGALGLRAEVGQRFGVAQQAESWWTVGATLRVTQTIGLTLTSGKTVSDVLLGLRGERATTVGLRLSAPQRSGQLRATPPAAGVEVVRLASRSFHLVFELPDGTRRAAIAADFNGWSSTALTRRNDGRWEITISAVAGVYRISLRHDNGPWQAPDGLPATNDGFGGKVGLVVLE